MMPKMPKPMKKTATMYRKILRPRGSTFHQPYRASKPKIMKTIVVAISAGLECLSFLLFALSPGSGPIPVELLFFFI